MSDPIAPGHGEPAPVSHIPVVLHQPAPRSWERDRGALPPIDGVPHCTKCLYYHLPEEPCHGS